MIQVSMKVNIQEITVSCLASLAEVLDELGEEFNLEFCTYWNNSFKEGQSLGPPEPRVSDIRKDVETVRNIIPKKKSLSYEDFEALGSLIKALGLQIEKSQRMGTGRKKK